jgi:hypothetical protein
MAALTANKMTINLVNDISESLSIVLRKFEDFLLSFFKVGF